MSESKRPATVMLGVNCPDTGCFEGRLSAVVVQHDGRQLMHLDCDDLAIEEIRMPERGPGEMRVEGEAFQILSWTSWVGNWCWDAVAMRWPEVERLLRLLQKHHATVTEAEVELYDAWENGRPIGEALEDVLQ